MMNHIDSMQGLSDDQLLSNVKALAKGEQQATARLIAGIAEVERRRLFLGQGYTSLFTYCTDALHLSEHAAYARIEAARVAQRFPVILRYLAEGELTLTAVCLLRPVLTVDNCDRLLAAARYKRKHDVEKLVAAIRPSADVPAVVRKLPVSKASAVVTPLLPAVPPQTSPVKAAATEVGRQSPDIRVGASSPAPAVLAPLAPGRYKIQFTASELRCRSHNAYEAALHFGSFLVREDTIAYDSVRTEFV